MKWSANKARTAQFVVGLGISGFCLRLALRNVPFNSLAQALSQADYFWVIAAISLQLIAVITRAERWRVLLEKRASLSDTFWAQGIGYLFTNVLPFRLGEPARIVALSARSHVPITQVVATVVVERLLDVATIVLVLVGVLPFMNVPATVQQAGLFFGLLVVVGLAFIYGLVRTGHRSEAWICRLSERFVPRYAQAITARWQELLQGFAGITQGKVAGAALFWSLVTWAFSLGMYWCVLRAFEPLARPVEAAFMVTALALAVTVPSGPGFIGVFQWVGQQALVLPFGTKYNLVSALAITMVAYLIYYLLTTLLGIIGLWQFGQSFSELGRTVSAQTQADGEPSPAL